MLGPAEWVIDAEGCIVLDSPLQLEVHTNRPAGTDYVVRLAEHRRLLSQNLARFATFH